MDLASVFMLSSVALVILRFCFYKETSFPLFTILVVAGILFMFGTYFAIVPYQTTISTTQSIYSIPSNIPTTTTTATTTI